MWIALLDHLAYNIDSFWHRANAFSKIIFLALVIISVVISTNTFYVASVFVMVIILMAASRLPVLRLSILLIYPLFFGVVFAISGVGEAAGFPILTILRAVTTASAVLLVIATTNYVDFFAALQRVFPLTIGDVMFITYRTFFVILDSFANTIKIARLRGAYSFLGLIRNLFYGGRVLGHSFIDAYETNQTTQMAMNVRGYQGRIVGSTKKRSIKINDVLIILLGTALFVAAVVLSV